MPKKSPKKDKIRDLIIKGHDVKDIAKIANTSTGTVYQVRSQMRRENGGALIPKKTLDINNYEAVLDNNNKYIIMKYGNELINRDISKVPINQLISVLRNSFDMDRIIQGKSTVNIAQNIIHGFNPDQLEIIKESIKSLKKSMLKVDSD